MPAQAVYLIDPTDSLVTPVSGAPVFNESTGHYEDIRTPSTWKAIGPVAGAGNTAIWTPSVGKRFRLLGFQISIPSTATTAAGSTIALFDGAGGIINLVDLGASSTGVNLLFNLPQNGYLSVAAGNVLNLNLTAALTTGAVLVSAWGDEE